MRAKAFLFICAFVILGISAAVEADQIDIGTDLAGTVAVTTVGTTTTATMSLHNVGGSSITDLDTLSPVPGATLSSAGLDASLTWNGSTWLLTSASLTVSGTGLPAPASGVAAPSGSYTAVGTSGDHFYFTFDNLTFNGSPMLSIVSALGQNGNVNPAIDANTGQTSNVSYVADLLYTSAAVPLPKTAIAGLLLLGAVMSATLLRGRFSLGR